MPDYRFDRPRSRRFGKIAPRRSLAQACERFLGLPISLLGVVHRDNMVTESVRHQVPLLKFAPNCQAAQDIREIARKIMDRRARLRDLIARTPILKSQI